MKENLLTIGIEKVGYGFFLKRFLPANIIAASDSSSMNVIDDEILLSIFTPLVFLSAMLGSPGAGLQNPINTVGPGQPTPTAISSAATHIDPSSMQRAYAALGLPYGNQSPAQVQGQGLSQQKLQGPQHQQLQNMNPLGTKLI